MERKKEGAATNDDGDDDDGNVGDGIYMRCDERDRTWRLRTVAGYRFAANGEKLSVCCNFAIFARGMRLNDGPRAQPKTRDSPRTFRAFAARRKV